MKSILKSILVSLLVGALSVGAAVAGGVLRPPSTLTGDPALGPQPTQTPSEPAESPQPDAGPSSGDEELSPEEIPPAAASDVSAPTGSATSDGTFLVGAARASLFPAPTLFGGEQWQTEGCTDYDAGRVEGDHLIPEGPNSIKGWPAASPDCIYLGGFGIGPVRPAERVGQGGVWVRTVAISNGQKTFVYSIADTVGWFARYESTICADCGILDVRERVASDLGIDAGDVVIGSTHTHAGADTYGGWGGIPDWYRNQIRDATVASAKQAVANLVPARIEVGEIHLRDRNNERRDTYYSNIDTGATWLQARSLPVTDCPGNSESGNATGNPNCTTSSRVIATWSTYAGHPTIVSDPILHADWPGAAARAFEGTFGGVGLVFEGGLGNASISGAGGEGDEEQAERTGIAFAQGVESDVADGGTVLTSSEMGAAVQDITHPTQSNPGLTTLAVVGLFDREFTPGTPGGGPPGTYYWSKRGELSSSGEDNDAEPRGETTRGCSSTGPTVRTTTGAHRIGDFVVAFAPGEIFSNIAEVVKEKADASSVTMVLGQTMDALGYIIQSFEFDSTTNAATEFGTGTAEYEEVFSIDRCFGDHVLEAMLESTQALEAGR